MESKCRLCDGSGYVVDGPDTVLCSYCRGSGWVETPFMLLGGDSRAGKTTLAQTAFPDPNLSVDETLDQLKNGLYEGRFVETDAVLEQHFEQGVHAGVFQKLTGSGEEGAGSVDPHNVIRLHLNWYLRQLLLPLDDESKDIDTQEVVKTTKNFVLESVEDMYREALSRDCRFLEGYCWNFNIFLRAFEEVSGEKPLYFVLHRVKQTDTRRVVFLDPCYDSFRMLSLRQFLREFSEVLD